MSAILHSIPIDRLERLRAAADLEVPRWSELLGLRARDYQELKPNDFLKVDSEHLQSLANDLELVPESILSGDIDYGALARTHSGDSLSIPERLSAAARSRVRTSLHLLDMLEHNFGWRERTRVLRKLQVSEAYLSNPDHVINLRFLTAVCDSLQGLGVTERTIYLMGGYSATKNYHSPMGDLFRSFPSLPDAFEAGYSELIGKYFDQNYLYRIERSRPGHIVVEARCNPDVMDGMREKRIGSSLVCTAKAGTMSTFTSYFRLSPADVTESACVHRGDDCCRYEIDYSKALAESKLRARKGPRGQA